MNDHDQQNLNFLLNVEQDTLAHWWEQCTEDDRQYARELLIEHSHVLVERELSLMKEYPDAVRVIDQVQ